MVYCVHVFLQYRMSVTLNVMFAILVYPFPSRKDYFG
jgi:hypothetical protein